MPRAAFAERTPQNVDKRVVTEAVWSFSRPQVMIYLIEGVLPEGYFANNLRGLSVDMAVFRDLLRVRLQNLSRHLDRLQTESKDSGMSSDMMTCREIRRNRGMMPNDRCRLVGRN